MSHVNPKIQQQYDPEFLRLADNVWTTVAEVCGDRIARKISYDEGVKALLPHLEAIQLRGSQQMREKLYEAAQYHGAITASQIEAGFGDMEQLRRTDAGRGVAPQDRL